MKNDSAPPRINVRPAGAAVQTHMKTLDFIVTGNGRLVPSGKLIPIFTPKFPDTGVTLIAAVCLRDGCHVTIEAGNTSHLYPDMSGGTVALLPHTRGTTPKILSQRRVSAEDPLPRGRAVTMLNFSKDVPSMISDVAPRDTLPPACELDGSKNDVFVLFFGPTAKGKRQSKSVSERYAVCVFPARARDGRGM